MNKITVEQAQDWEKEALVDALYYGCIELTDEFLSRFTSKEFQKHMSKWETPQDRAHNLPEIKTSRWIGTIHGQHESHIFLSREECEFQFEGDPEEAFEDPTDWHINGDLAYCSLGYGLCLDFDDI